MNEYRTRVLDKSIILSHPYIDFHPMMIDIDVPGIRTQILNELPYQQVQLELFPLEAFIPTIFGVR